MLFAAQASRNSPPRRTAVKSRPDAPVYDLRMADTHASLPSPDRVRALRERRHTITGTVPVRHSSERIWPYLTQVDLYNRASGASPVKYAIAPGEDGTTTFRAHARKAGATVSYVELPYEWHAPHFVHGELFFENGPFCYGRIRGEYDEEQHAVRYVFDYVPRRRFSIAGLLARLLLNKYLKIVRGIDAQLPDEGADPMGAAGFARRTEATLRGARDLARSWASLAPDPVIAETFAELVCTAPDPIVARLRPYVVARQLGTARDETLQFCFRAADAGFLKAQWDMVCPSCGGAKQRAASIAALGTQAHCEVCNIRWDRDLERNVEVSFQPSARIRTVDEREFCLQSPSHQRQILAQVNVMPRSSLRLALHLTPGHHRLRCIGRDGEMLFDSAYGRSRQEMHVDVTTSVPSRQVECGGVVDLVVANESDAWRTVRFERHAYREDAATAAEIAAMPGTRDRVGDVASLLATPAAETVRL